MIWKINSVRSPSTRSSTPIGSCQMSINECFSECVILMDRVIILLFFTPNFSILQMAELALKVYKMLDFQKKRGKNPHN